MNRIIALFLMGFCAITVHGQFTYGEVDRKALSEILNIIEQHNEVSFSYKDQNITDYLISYQGGEYTLSQLLEKVFDQTALRYEFIDDRHIVILQEEMTDRILCGFLKDKSNDEAIPFATVMNTEETRGVSTQENGYFEFRLSGDDQQLIASFLGYEKLTIPVSKHAIIDCREYEMERQQNIFETVTVTEYLDDGISLPENMSRIEVDPQQANMLPGSVEPDVLSTLAFLPGITSPTESLDRLYIRGGTPDQNLILWDDIPVYHSSHMFGAITGFNPFMVEKVDVYRNGVSSRYGGRVSSVIDIKSKSKVPEKRFQGGVGMNMTQSHYELEARLGRKSALFLSGRFSMTDAWQSPTFKSYAEKVFQESKIDVSSLSQTENFVRFNDGTLKWIYNPGSNKFAISILGTLNNLSYRTGLPASDAVFSVDNHTLDHGGIKMSWDKAWGDSFRSEVVLTTTNFRNTFGSEYGLRETEEILPVYFNSENKLDEGIFRSGFEWDLSANKKVRFGYQFTDTRIFLKIDSKDLDTEEVSNQLNQESSINALYLDYSMNLSDLAYLDIGLRYHSAFNNRYFEPRINVSADITDNLKLKLSTSKNFQFVSQLVVFDINGLGLGDQIWVVSNNTNIPVIEASHWTGGVIYTKDSWTIDADAYVKEISGITSFIDPELNIPFSAGGARISGIDLLLKKRFGNYRSWLSYTLSNADYEFLTISPEAFPTTYDQRHVYQWVHLYKMNRFEFSLGLSMKSGLPYTNVTLDDEGELVYGPINGSRLPSYVRLDGSVVYRWSKKGNRQSFVAFSFQNLFDRNNVIGRQYVDSDEEENRLIPVDRLGFGFTPNLSLNFTF